MINVLLNKNKLKQRFNLFRNRNFRLLWFGSLVAMMGDFFLFVGMPFLIMNLTEDRATIGGVLAVAGIPRALLLLFGGALSDRFSPLLMMKVSRVAFMLLLLLMTTLILNESISIAGLYVFSGLMGVIGAFGMPASMAILPLLVKREELAPANAITGSTSQLISALAPALVGIAVLYLSTEPFKAILLGSWPAIEDLPRRADMQGIGLAYAIDALLIIVSMIPLWLIKLETEPKQPNQTDSIMTSIQDGFSYVWQDASLRAFIIYMTITTFVSMGPQMVGMPVLADDNLNGMRSFGVLMSAQGLGAVFGSLLAAFATPAASLLGPVVMTLAIVRGFGTLLIAAITSDQQGILLMTSMGILTGYSSIVFMTWVQKRVSLEYIGRVMSLVMLAVMGLQPLSQGFSGWFIDFAGVTTLFISIGFFMIITPFFALLSADIRNMGEPKKTQQ